VVLFFGFMGKGPTKPEKNKNCLKHYNTHCRAGFS
jgi:hypothetical protein